ncbi:flagellar protein FliS [Bradyrhizobium diazoefficiens]|jgi:flagellar protein FliS|nr:MULTISPECIES: flagellar export chaperone FliS [Bradyrhizobium]APO54265.1 flagellar biosynthesis protein FliS [Bradyrhizobium diazoefficiens]KOY11210.1 flagellar biosynthesis protein FliS [Bradyrhizobium diazoefficiens]MCD9292865.1 flagellar protein FliS [Bradyrhizobium diazoefficiens]MCD9808175.1 flagellar protein FliS [Bradyrhizobium diazoefficiens]MCD9826521.1 flagellar protein FliS [Bradyrhizobium diazoefficiens]
MMHNQMAYLANQAYRGAATTVPPLKAVSMLLGGAAIFLQKALVAQESRRFEEGHEHLMKATAILRGLSHNLDFTNGRDVAERLYQTYNALILASLRAYGRPDARESFRRIIAGLAEMREAWEFVDAASRGGKADSAPSR